MGVTTGVGSPLKTGGPPRSAEVALEDLAKAIDGMSTELSSPSARALDRAGWIVANNISDEARKKGATSFAGKPYRGYIARTTRMRSEPYTIITPKGGKSAVGATVTLDQGSRPHLIAARNPPDAVSAGAIAGAGGKAVPNRFRRRAGGKKALMYAGLPHPVLYVHHPGSRGKNFVTPGFDKGTAEAFTAWNRLMFIETIGGLVS
ncbi:MAG: hypothetical protein HKN01_01565 [Acidimicrobiia bacterium]|nr:hypothetical protein [Acidimicrobiia bacterium]